MARGSRKAGALPGQVAGASQTAARDAVETIALLAGATGLSVTGLMGLLDYFSGDARIDNSGEYFVNPLIMSIPAATGALGLGVGAVMDPVARADLAARGELNVAKLMAKDFYGRKIDEGRQAMTEDEKRAAIDAMNRVQSSRQNLNQKMGEAQQKAPDIDVLRRARSRVGIGAGLGAALGTVPALYMLSDAPRQTQEVG